MIKKRSQSTSIAPNPKKIHIKQEVDIFEGLNQDPKPKPKPKPKSKPKPKAEKGKPFTRSFTYSIEVQVMEFEPLPNGSDEPFVNITFNPEIAKKIKLNYGLYKDKIEKQSVTPMSSNQQVGYSNNIL